MRGGSVITRSLPSPIIEADPTRAAALALKMGARYGEVCLSPLAPSGLTHRGVYAAGTAYVAGDVVVSSNAAYRCIASTTGNAPPNATYWVVMADDWARLAAVCAACAGKYAVRCARGEWVCGSDQTAMLRTDLDLSFEPGSGITSTVAGTGVPTENCVFAHHADYTVRTTLLEATVAGYSYVVATDPTNVAALSTIRFGVDQKWTARKVLSKSDAISGNSQLSALVLTGATLVNTDTWKLYFNLTKPAAVPVLDIYSDAGKTVKVAEGTRADDLGGAMTITEVGGSGLTGTVTMAATVVPDSGANNIMVVGGRLNVDSPIPRVYAAGLNIETFTPITNCHVRFNGAAIRSGSTGNRIWECVASQSCSLEGLVVEAGTLYTDVLCSWDIPSRDCWYQDCIFHDVPATSKIALFFECSERCGALRCHVDGCLGTTEAAVYVTCGVDCWLDHVTVDYPLSHGIFVGQVFAYRAAAYASRNTILTSCVVRGANQADRSGIRIDDWSIGTKLSSVKAQDCRYGITNDGASTGTTGINLETSRCGNVTAAYVATGCGVYNGTGCDLSLDVARCVDDPAGGIINYGTLRLTNSVISASAGYPWIAIQFIAGTMHLVNVAIANATGSTHGVKGLGTGTVYMTNVTCTAQYGCYINGATTHAYWIGDGCSFTGANPFTDTPGSTFNFNIAAGPALTEATPLAIAFRGMTATAMVRLEVYDANGATAEKQPVVAKTPGTGVTLTSVSGDVRKINWKIAA